MRWLRALGALTLLVGVLLGLPWLLQLVGDPGVLLTVDWARALTRPDDGTVILGVLSVVAWAAWLVLAGTIVAELVAVLTRRRIDIRLPGTAWLRPVIGSLVAAATLAPTGLAVADSPPPEAAAHAGVVPAAARPASDSPPAAPAPTGRIHVVQPGDELWSVAEQQLGSGERWRDLLVVNQHLDATSRLVPGARLQLPPDVVVRSGDSLWLLAERHLGDGARWTEIHELNHDLVTDPDHIEVGWRLLLPVGNRSAITPEVETQRPDPPPAADPATDFTAEPSAAQPSEAPPAPPAPATREHSVQPTPEHEPAPEPPADAAEMEAEDAGDSPLDDEAETDGVLGPIGGLLAGTLVVGLASRRRLQLLSRAVGRRLLPFGEEAARFWTALGRRKHSAEGSEALTATTVVLGWRDDGSDVAHDLERARATWVGGDGDSQSLVGAMLTSIACAPWSSDVETVVVGADQPWAEALDDPRITQLDDTATGVASFLKLCAARRLALGTDLLDDVRSDPDRAPSFQPVVYLFARALLPREQERVREALGFGSVGASVVVAGPSAGEGAHLHFDGDSARLGGVTFRPQLVTAPARRALVELFATSGGAETEEAPWFAGDPSSPDDEARFGDVDPIPGAPYIVLLDEPDILDAAGDPPQRARQQCVEYAAWLLLHPGSRSTTMQRALVVAEGTRRSNLSRLRKWLGADDAGIEYLPDAYSGRVQLDERVGSDWLALQSLIARGVSRAHDRALRQALSMVGGPPLGTAAQRWPWAGTLHDDMVSTIIDIACVLADRCLDAGHVEEALWALDQAELASPGHDEVAVRRVRAHSLEADEERAEEAARELVTRIREDNRELAPEHARQLALARRHLAEAPRRQLV